MFSGGGLSVRNVITSTGNKCLTAMIQAKNNIIYDGLS